MYYVLWGFPGKESTYNVDTWFQSQGLEDSLEEDMATTSVFFPGESLWIEEPGRLQSIGPQRVGHD